MTKQTAMVFMCMSTGLAMKDIGKMIFKMDGASKLGQTDLNTKVTIKKA